MVLAFNTIKALDLLDVFILKILVTVREELLQYRMIFIWNTCSLFNYLWPYSGQKFLCLSLTALMTTCLLPLSTGPEPDYLPVRCYMLLLKVAV